jgi:translocation and assembly module TamB
VDFGGRVVMNGFTPGELNLTAIGEDMRVRYPEGFVSRIDANLWLRGTMASPVLGGTVTVEDAVWTRRFDIDPNIFNFGGGRSLPSAGPAPSGLPLRFDVQINAPRSLRVQNNIADIVSTAELRLQGTYDRPLLFGHAEIDRGSIIFEGNRYVVTRGSIDFLNPAGRLEPLFDIEAETRIRVPSQTYRVTLGIAGTADQASLNLGSDPPLPAADIISLLLGGTTNLEDAELRPLRPEAAEETQQALLRQALGRLLTAPLSAPVRRVVEETFGVTAQLATSLGTETDPLSASARLILGRRLSPRAFVTYSRSLGTATRDQIIILEYDQSDRLGFVLTRNNEGTFAIDFRVRHSF